MLLTDKTYFSQLTSPCVPLSRVDKPQTSPGTRGSATGVEPLVFSHWCPIRAFLSEKCSAPYLIHENN